MTRHQAKLQNLLKALLLWASIVAVQIVIVAPSAWAQQAPSGFTPIYDIQGEGAGSPLVDLRVDTFGVVTGVTSDGFYLQDPTGDGDPFTSDGIYVFTYQSPSSTFPAVRAGACLAVRDALVQEYYGKTELNWVDSVEPSTACPRFTVTPAVSPDLKLSDDTEELYERLEGMLVELDGLDGFVHGPTKRYVSGEAEIAFLPSNWQQAVLYGRVLRSSQTTDTQDNYLWPESTLQFVSSRLGGDLPDASWGDRIQSGSIGADPVRAILDFNFGKYQLLLLPEEELLVAPASSVEEIGSAASPQDYTVCTYNVHGLGRGEAQHPSELAYEQAVTRSAQVIAETLQECSIVGLQETGTPEDARVIAARLTEEHRVRYEPVAMLGPMSGDTEFPLTNSFLVRADRVKLVNSFTAQGCSERDYGVAAIESEQCLPGQYPLFSRPPLVIDVLVDGDWGEPVALRLINNHWKSKAGDEAVNARRRVLQAEHVAKIVEETRESGADQIIVLGDLNDFSDSTPLQRLTQMNSGLDEPMVDVWNYLTLTDRYSFIFNGASQVLDHILITPNMVQSLANVDALHINVDHAHCAPDSRSDKCQASDHDPLMIRLRPGGATSVGGALGFAGIRVELENIASGEIFASISGSDGEFRLWDVPQGTAHVSYMAPDWLHIDDSTSGNGSEAVTVVEELAYGFTMLDAPPVRLLPAIRAAEAASSLVDAALAEP